MMGREKQKVESRGKIVLRPCTTSPEDHVNGYRLAIESGIDNILLSTVRFDEHGPIIISEIRHNKPFKVIGSQPDRALAMIHTRKYLEGIGRNYSMELGIPYEEVARDLK
jgi:hypothetical protein